MVHQHLLFLAWVLNHTCGTLSVYQVRNIRMPPVIHSRSAWLPHSGLSRKIVILLQYMANFFNSLAPGRCGSDFESIISLNLYKLMLRNKFISTSYEIALRWGWTFKPLPCTLIELSNKYEIFCKFVRAHGHSPIRCMDFVVHVLLFYALIISLRVL